MLGIDGAMCVWHCVHVVHMVLCTYGVVFMIVQLALRACGDMYMLHICYCVQLLLCTCRAYGVVYMWCHVHVHMVLCTYDIVYTLYKWYDVHVAFCTHCASGAMYM